MKNILFKVSIFLILGIIGIMKLNVHPFVEDKSKIKVSIVYKETSKIFELEPYSQLSEILNQIELDEDADLNAINENQILKHKDKIVIPIIKETPCISINHANIESLMLINGIGPKMAERIVEYRGKHGYFQTIEAIKNVKGIGDKTFEKMKDQLCI